MQWVVLAVVSIGCGRINFDPLTREVDATPMTTACKVSDPNLSACYEFEGNVIDATDNHNDGLATSVSFEPGKVGKALTATQMTRLRVADSPSLARGTALTVQAWFRLDMTQAAPDVAMLVDHNGGYAIYVNGTSLTCQANTASGSHPLIIGTINLGTWHHVACTYDGARWQTYLDGVPQDSTAATGALDNVGDALEIGGNAPDAADPNLDRFLGALDELQIWAIARSQAEICLDAMSC